MAKRVFELAREMGVTSKVVLDKCSAEGLPLKNHMAALSAGLEATIREWFTEGDTTTAVETAEHVDLESARAEARKRRRRQAAEKAEREALEAKTTEEQPSEEAPEQAPEETPETPPEEAPPQAPPEEAPVVSEPAEEVEQPLSPEVTVPEAPAEAEEAPQEQGEQAPAQEPPPVAQTPEVEQAPVAEEPQEAAAQAPEEQQQAQEEQEEEEKEKKPIKPAGPQLVPKPARLKGPRVIRVEKPDFIRPPVPRQQMSGPAIGQEAGPSRRPRVGVGQNGEHDDKKTKRRSPRRRGGGRTGDSGEKLKEWRDKDLMERNERLAAASGGTLRRHRASLSRKGEAGGPIQGQEVEVEEPVTVKNLSAATGLKASEIIARLMKLGVMATVNQSMETEHAEMVVSDYGIKLIVKKARNAEDTLLSRINGRQKGDMKHRAPVVTFLGHVDHGKTSLLDYIRKAKVAPGEAGGITQHIGAYRYDDDEGKHVVFLDTPGHEAFTAMRARGANMTDVVVLVVAADDGVMPQTIEAISHAKAANVPIIVALNKIDTPNANVQRAYGQLAEHGLTPRQWGGDVEVIETSAHTGQGMDVLLETLSLEAELLELKSEIDAPADGYVIEAEMSPGKGIVARLLVRNGTLSVGDIMLAGQGFGKVRSMMDSKGKSVTSAGPSNPVEVSGLDEMPQAGDRFFVTVDLDEARKIAEDRRNAARQVELATSPAKTLQNLLSQIESGEASELALIIKADMQGSIEALVDSLNNLSTDEIRVNILHTAVGGITTGDVTLAEASDAIIIGFNVVPDAPSRQLAEQKGVDIRLYRVIYEIIEDIHEALERGLAPEIRMETMGRALVRQTFKVSRLGTIAGCHVSDGNVNRNAKVRIIRNGIVIEDERSLESLKRFKDDVREVRAGMECGLKIAGYDNVKEGDILEFYQKVEVARKL